MKKLLFLVAIFCALKTNAQTYNIYFTGSGATTTVTTITVENLTEGTSITFSGSKSLNLNLVITGINTIEDNKSSKILIYPNPMTDNSVIQINPPTEGNSTITVSDISGKQLAQKQCYLEKALQEFRLSGIKSGLYMVSVKGNNYQFSGKLLCNGRSNGGISIEKISNNTQATDKKVSNGPSKAYNPPVDWSYKTGDLLKFTGISGNYSTVVTDVPTGNKTITFNFVACTDGDNNNYPAIQIGTQTWMAENLKTTMYRNGVSIGTTSPYNKDISGESAPTYQWAYAGNESNVATYGRLYTWYAVMDSRNVCPTGWHLPTDAEWTTLESYLIANGYNYDGTITVNKIAKALASTSGWTVLSTIGTVGNTDYPGKRNATGFTALPGGYRNYDGTSYTIGSYGYWWSATQLDVTYAWNRSLRFNGIDVLLNFADKKSGDSVRCIKDN